MRRTIRLAVASAFFLLALLAVKQLASSSSEEGCGSFWLDCGRTNGLDEEHTLLVRIRGLDHARRLEQVGWFLSAANASDLAMRADAQRLLADLSPELVNGSSETSIQASDSGKLYQQHLLEASRISPHWSGIRIKLGLQAEAYGDLPSAEFQLLEAARVDRQFLPAWTLANYYLRQHNRASFWLWARLCAATDFDSYIPLIRVTDAMDPNPAAVLARLDNVVPLAKAYMDYLIGADRLRDAGQVVKFLKALARNRPAENRAQVSALQISALRDRLLKAGDIRGAWELRNDLRRTDRLDGQ